MQHGSECGRGRPEGGVSLVGLLWASSLPWSPRNVGASWADS